jgi:hypothetical protein
VDDNIISVVDSRDVQDKLGIPEAEYVAEKVISSCGHSPL